MKEKLKRFLWTFFYLLGFTLLLLLVLAQIADVPEEFNVRMGNALTLFVAIASVISIAILKRGVSLRELWMRRIAVTLIDALTAPGSMILCGVVRYSSWRWYLVYMGGCFAVHVVIALIVYRVTDRIEKRTLNRINEKLREE